MSHTPNRDGSTRARGVYEGKGLAVETPPRRLPLSSVWKLEGHRGRFLKLSLPGRSGWPAAKAFPGGQDVRTVSGYGSTRVTRGPRWSSRSQPRSAPCHPLPARVRSVAQPPLGGAKRATRIQVAVKTAGQPVCQQAHLREPRRAPTQNSSLHTTPPCAPNARGTPPTADLAATTPPHQQGPPVLLTTRKGHPRDSGSVDKPVAVQGRTAQQRWNRSAGLGPEAARRPGCAGLEGTGHGQRDAEPELCFHSEHSGSDHGTQDWRGWQESAAATRGPGPGGGREAKARPLGILTARMRGQQGDSGTD
ncbi:PREDICTED: uncharacterized protein LOC102016669 isoform X2 [Chinchilla lanigera]|uniref:uncharacterized protein LOC102016669 isoform X2 n=1 Tax=Chinchilla lanigera TaxID=34839 RepID=UPI00038EEB7C|nr:PREDICTED: uncharacterized protein LOC102016669 isoform X2 [Chinchilla lanigera]